MIKRNVTTPVASLKIFKCALITSVDVERSFLHISKSILSDNKNVFLFENIYAITKIEILLIRTIFK